MGLVTDIDEGGARSSAQSHPNIFVRAFAVPAGFPWEQTRAAQLEARHGAPLPIADVHYRFRRISPWTYARPARFAAFYVRSEEYRSPFETIVDVDGQPIKVAFGASANSLRQARLLVATALVFGVVALVIGGAVTTALGRREQLDVQLTNLEQAAARKLVAARRAQQEDQQRLALTRVIGESTPVADVIADLAWATGAKAPDARIAAIHWQSSLLAVESRGEAAPFELQGRRLERSAKPIRPGVWLWAAVPVSRSSPSGRQALR